MTGLVTIVTGAGAGIGRAIALTLAEVGHRVLVADVNGADADSVAGEITDAGGSASAFVVDVAEEDQVRDMVAATVERYGRLDCAVNNAGIRPTNKLMVELEAAEWRRVMSVNLDGVFYCMKHQIRMMRPSGGAIVNISSANGVVALPYAAEYVASKHGVVGLTRAASSEAGLTGVRVNAVLPGVIMTPPMIAASQNPESKKFFEDSILKRMTVGRAGQPEDVSSVVRWLLAPGSEFMNGAMISVDGGYTAC